MRRIALSSQHHSIRPDRSKKWLRQPTVLHTEGWSETVPSAWVVAAQFGLDSGRRHSWITASQPQGHNIAACQAWPFSQTRYTRCLRSRSDKSSTRTYLQDRPRNQERTQHTNLSHMLMHLLPLRGQFWHAEQGTHVSPAKCPTHDETSLSVVLHILQAIAEAETL